MDALLKSKWRKSRGRHERGDNERVMYAVSSSVVSLHYEKSTPKPK